MPDIEIGALSLLSAVTANGVLPLQAPGGNTKGVRLDQLGLVLPSSALSISHIASLSTSLAGKQRSHRADVRDFGVSTGGSGDNTTGLNNAAASLTNGGELYIPPGTVTYAGPIVAPESVHVVGDGPNVSVLRCTSTTNDFIQSTGTNLVGVRNIQLESLVTRTAGYAINFSNVSGYIIDNVRFVDTFNAARFNNSHSGWLSRLKVAHGGGVWNQGFWWQSCIDTHVLASLLNGGTAQLGSGKAWFMIDSGNDTFAAHDVGTVCSSGAGTGFRFYHSLSPGSFAPRWIRLSHIYCEGSSGVVGAGRDGIQIDDALNLYLESGYTGTSLNGLVINGGTDLRFGKFLSMNNWLRGVVLSAGYITTFDTCTFDSNSQGADGNVGHFYIGPSTGRTRIEESYFGNAVLSRTNQPSYAIENYATAANVVCRDNEFELSALRTAALGGPNIPIMRDNFGFNPRGALGPPTVPASNVAYSNDYGVDCAVYVAGGTVSAIKVNGATTGITSGLVRVGPGRTITLTYTAAPTWVWIGE
jgi:hypothetical protein